MLLARQELLQIDFRGERHDWVAYIFPSFPRPARPRFSARAARNSRAMSQQLGRVARSTPGSFRASRSPASSDSFRITPALGPHENLGVARLVIVGRVGKRNQNRRAAKRRRAPPGWPRRNGRSRNRPRCKLPPSRDETRRRKPEFFRADNCRPRAVRRGAGQMNHLERRILQRRQRFDHRLIDPARALASAHDQQREQIRAQAEPLPRDFSIDGAAARCESACRSLPCALSEKTARIP